MSDRIRVLYAEDSPTDADLTSEHFKAAADVHLEVVSTAQRCLERLASEHYDVLLLDNHLPDMEGLDVLALLARRGISVPSVLLTAVGDEALVVRALRLGAWDYVPKHGDYLDTLPAVVRAAASEHRRGPARGLPRRRRVLYAEHDPADVDLTVHHFATAAPQIDLEVVGSAAGALERMAHGGIDLLLIDLRMPDLSALEVLRQVRHRVPVLPVIVITGGGDEGTAIAALKLGAYDYIVKRDAYLMQLPYAIENAVQRAELVEINRRLNVEIEARVRREAENTRLLEAVEANQRRLDALVSSVPGVVWEGIGVPTGPDYRIQFISRYVEDLVGYPVEQWLEAPNFWFEVTHPEDRERVGRETAEAFAAGQPFTSQFRWLARDGRAVWVEARIKPIVDDRGRAIGLRGVTTDISEQKQAEEQRAQLEAQLLQSQKLESVGRLAGGVAHDFNNLLTAINGYADLIRQELDPNSPIAADLLEIRTAGERAAALTQQLLAFSRRQLLQPRVLDLNALIEGTTKLLARVLGEDVQVVTDFDPALGRIRADPGQMEQVLMNLAVNARDAMPGGGMLTIQTRNVVLDEAYSQGHLLIPAGPYVLTTVSDTGHGMDAQTLPHIFEPFFTTKESGKGTGLGLSTVYGIVKQSGGWVWAYSEPGHGSAFKIYMPRVDEATHVDETEQPDQHERRGSETVLVVEDDETVRKLIVQVLIKSGYDVLETASAEEAVRLAAEHEGRIPLLITDLVMPVMNGRELAHHLSTRHPNMRVLYMSGYTDDSVVRHGLLAAGVDFMQKPFTPRALGRKVREVLDRT